MIEALVAYTCLMKLTLVTALCLRRHSCWRRRCCPWRGQCRWSRVSPRSSWSAECDLLQYAFGSWSEREASVEAATEVDQRYIRYGHLSTQHTLRIPLQERTASTCKYLFREARRPPRVMLTYLPHAVLLCCAVEYKHVASAQRYMRERRHPRGTESFGFSTELSRAEKLWRLPKFLVLPLFYVFGLCFISGSEKER